MKEKPIKTRDQRRIEKDRILFEKIFKSLTVEERKATFLVRSGEAFAGLFQGHAKKYRVELPSIFKSSQSSPETLYPQVVRASLHTELQKFGHRPKPHQLGLFSQLLDPTKKQIETEGIKVVGIDISADEDRALFAVQRIFHQTGYKGNVKGREIDDKHFKYTGLLPAIEFTPAQFLEAFGVKKYKTAQGKMVYDGRKRARAFKALMDLSKKPVLFVYKRKYRMIDDKGKEVKRIDRIEAIGPLIRMAKGWEALRDDEDIILDKGKSSNAINEKLTVIAVEPSPVLVQDIIGYALLKPANFKEEIKLLHPQASKFVYRFAEYLMTQAELKRRGKAELVIRENYLTIAYALRMDAYIETRQHTRIRQILNKCYKIAKELGYLLEYKTIQGQTMELEGLTLNPEKFARPKKEKV